MTEELGFKFSILLRLDVFAIQPNLLFRSIVLGLHAFIICSFLEFLGVK